MRDAALCHRVATWATPQGATVHFMPWDSDDQSFVGALQQGHVAAAAELFDRYQADVNRIVWRVLGADSEHDDLVQDVFAKALKSVGQLRDPGALRGWLMSLAVKTVRSELRRRRYRRFLPFADALAPEGLSTSDDHEGQATVARTYAVLDKLPADERIVFVLRFIDGKALEEVASVCACSLATVKRRLQQAQSRFLKLAAREPLLAERLRTSDRWKQS